MEKGRVKGQREVLFAFVFLLVCFLVVALFRASFSGVNLSVNVWAASVNGGGFTKVALLISDGFDTTSLLVLSLGAGAVLLVIKHGWYGLLLLGAMGGEALLVLVGKTLVMSPRPMNEILAETGYSFPSGHTTSTVVFFGIVTYYVWQHYSSIKAKSSSLAFYAGIVGLVSFDRIYLNVHWLSDIVGSMLLGGSWVLFCIFVFEFVANHKLILNRQVALS